MKNGPYTLVLAPEGYSGKKYRGLYAYEHHVVYWQANGEFPAGMQIHHIDGDHTNNIISNLRLVTKPEHHKLHGELLRAKHRIVFNCPVCDKTCTLKGNVYRTRMRASKSGRLYCSRSCGSTNSYMVRDGREEMRLPVKQDQPGAVPGPGAKSNG